MQTISIVIPTYNRGHIIDKTLLSLSNQVNQDFEIIIIDDGSTDNTEEVVKPFLSERISFHKKNNAERAAARNFGTKLAKGTYINWFDSDDIAKPNHIEEALLQIKLNNNPIWLHLWYECLSGHTITDMSMPSNIGKFLKEGNCLSCNGVFVRRDVALINQFNEDRELSASEDYELWLRILSQHPIVVSDVVTSQIVQHDERSVFMSNPTKLIQRFEKFVQYSVGNRGVAKFLGDKLGIFIAKNYLILAVDLAANGHKRLAIKYLVRAIKSNRNAFLSKTFYAILKHLLLSKKA